MRRQGDKKLASVVAIAGAVSLLSAPVGLYAEGGRQSGAARSQTEREQYPGAGQEQSGAQQLSRENIREVQEKLNEMGHDAGPADGVWGPQTQAAIKNFQQEKQIEATGQLDQQTLNELGVEIDGQEPGMMERLREGFQRDDQTERSADREQGSSQSEGSSR
jgi:hypothetical protein